MVAVTVNKRIFDADMDKIYNNFLRRRNLIHPNKETLISNIVTHFLFEQFSVTLYPRKWQPAGFISTLKIWG